MKQIIKGVLEKHGKLNVNLGSDAARDVITKEIIEKIKNEDKADPNKDIMVKERETWVCSICGKNTYDVDWDYIGSRTNHLECELQINKLSEEIVDDKSKKYIYESPDGGKTIYRREFQKSEREVVEDWKTEMSERKEMIEKSNKSDRKWSGRYEDFIIKEKQADEKTEENLDWYENWKKETFNNDDPVDKDRKRYAG